MSAPLMLGTAPIANLHHAVLETQAREVLEASWDLGMRSLDTAPFYGHSLAERRIGDFHRAHPGRRFAVSTKVGRRLEPGTSAQPTGFVDTPPLRPVFDYSREGILSSFEDSLERLGLTRVETLLLHDIGGLVHGRAHPAIFDQALEEAIPAMRKLQAQGRVGEIGLGVNEWQVCAEVLARTELDVILLAGRFTLLEQGAEDFLDQAAARGVRIMGAGVFNSGLLAGGSTYNYVQAPPEVTARRDAIAAVCGRHGVALPAAAIHFVARNPAISKVVLGLRSPEQVRQAIAWAAQIPPDALWQELRHGGLIS